MRVAGILRNAIHLSLAVGLFSWVLANQALALSVEEAYRAIPHRRSVFNSQDAKIPVEERQYLQRFFRLVDLAIVERVGMLLWVQSKGSRGEPATHYDRLLNDLKVLRAPPGLKDVHEFVVKAIEDQRAALEAWRRSGLPSNIAQDPLVGRSSQNLRRAYDELMRLFPQEGQHNKDAFFDYLCALDFS